MAATEYEVSGIRELGEKEAAELFDRQARALTGMSGPEFLSRWRAGDFTDTADDNILHMIMLLPLVITLASSQPLAPLGPAARIGGLLDQLVSKLWNGAGRRWQERAHTRQ